MFMAKLPTKKNPEEEEYAKKEKSDLDCMIRKEIYSLIEFNYKRHNFAIRKMEKSYNILE